MRPHGVSLSARILRFTRQGPNCPYYKMMAQHWGRKESQQQFTASMLRVQPLKETTFDSALDEVSVYTVYTWFHVY